MTKEEINCIRVAVNLADNFRLKVEDVMKLLNCDEEYANRVMHELVLVGVGFWSTIDGSLKYNFFWNHR